MHHCNLLSLFTTTCLHATEKRPTRLILYLAAVCPGIFRLMLSGVLPLVSLAKEWHGTILIAVQAKGYQWAAVSLSQIFGAAIHSLAKVLYEDQVPNAHNLWCALYERRRQNDEEEKLQLAVWSLQHWKLGGEGIVGGRPHFPPLLKPVVGVGEPSGFTVTSSLVLGWLYVWKSLCSVTRTALDFNVHAGSPSPHPSSILSSIHQARWHFYDLLSEPHKAAIYL